MAGESLPQAWQTAAPCLPFYPTLDIPLLLATFPDPLSVMCAPGVVMPPQCRFSTKKKM
ncbi:hypothetical protein Hanom_Chr07g00649061 [Helianthus anomalus]